ncbi:MAG: nodulation protein NfeD, partial [SAR202 cluster bacterium]|nr:nodulation protein NfeD [SAR202 cluster bacterium]
MRKLVRLLGAAMLVTGLFAAWQGAAAAQSPSQRDVYIVRLEGMVNPVTARHVLRHLGRAEERGAEAFILTLDTPGGLDTAMRDIVKGFLNAKVPTVVFVSPRGARAASAGAFITAAAHVAAMAPGTNIGAATPVSLGAELPETLERKATNDAAAYIREIALVRGRNPDWLEDTVRKAASGPATEALERNVVDLIADDLPQLLQALDGRTVSVDGVNRALRAQGVALISREMGFFGRLLNFIADPTIATLLISLGSLALVIELYNPGIMVGVVGGIALALGLVGVGNLPVNWVGVALILAGAVLLALELVVTGFGALGIAS